MRKHRVILGIVQLVFGVLIAFLLVGTNLSNTDAIFSAKWLIQFIVGICFFVNAFSGFYLIKNKPWALSLSLKSSFIWLVTFPLGLVVIFYNYWLRKQVK